MFTFQIKKSKNYLLKLAVASAIAALTGCGGSSSDGGTTSALTTPVGNTDPAVNTIDVSGLTDQKIRAGLTTGMTQGITSSTNAVSSVFADSKVFTEISAQTDATQSPVAARSVAGDLDGLDEEGLSATLDSSLESLSSLLDESSISQSGNVYTFDPNEAQVCTDSASTAQEVANCQTVVSHITFVVTVDKVVNDEVTAATTVFKYDTSTFAQVGFTDNSGYYEVQLAGARELLTGLNEVATAEDAIDIPTVMQGSFRVAFTAESENSGSVTVSIPTAISLSDDTAGNEMLINIGATNKLLNVTADGVAKTMEAEVGLAALDIRTTDEDDTGNSLPLQLVTSAITGKVVLSDNGSKLALSGISVGSVTFKVDNTDAMTLGLGSLDAILDATGSNSAISLSKALDFDFSMINIRNYFDSEEPASNELAINVDATSGTTLAETSDDIIKVTNGTVDIAVDATGDDRLEVSIPNGGCLNTDAIAAVDCPTSN